MRRGYINWEEFAKALLWNRIVYDKNGNSGYEVDTTHEVGNFSIRACQPNAYKELTWKELCLELGIWEDMLLSDGHNCKECPERNNCSAYFKDDPDQEQCSGWQKLYGFSKAPSIESQHLSEEEITKAYHERWFKSAQETLKKSAESVQD